jgi:hypothetical protein
MRKELLFIFLLLLGMALFLDSASPVMAAPVVNPEAVDYPLMRPTAYPSRKGDPYEATFGVRRWLNPVRSRQDPDFKQTVQESLAWYQVFSGYGVPGHGEDVFTRQGAQYRRLHRGR